MKDEAGNWLAKADSQWVYMDIEKGGFATIDEGMADQYGGIDDKIEVSVDTKRIRLPEALEEMESFRVQKSHLDTNNHVNNGQYIKMAMAYLPEKIQMHQVKVEYKRQALLGDVIIPKVYVDNNVQLVALCGEDSKPYAVIEIR